MFDQIKRGNQTQVDHTDTTEDPSEGDSVGKIKAETTKCSRYVGPNMRNADL